MKARLFGFTLIEMLVTLTLIGIAASVALPFGAMVETRAKEAELRAALRTIRQALDQYKAAADAGAIDKPTGTSGYPPNLDVLVRGVPRSAALGINATPFVLLRKIPRDPFFTDQSVEAAQSWNVRSYGAAPRDFAPGPDVFDVTSRSDRRGLDGSLLSEW